MPNCSATTSDTWLGSITPPEPTRMVVVASAMLPISTGGAELAMPGMLWCSATQNRRYPSRSACRARSMVACRACAAVPPSGTGARSSTDKGTDPESRGPKVRAVASTTCPNRAKLRILPPPGRGHAPGPFGIILCQHSFANEYLQSYVGNMGDGEEAHGRTVTRLTDPRALRAYAHPVRMRLIGLLRTEGPLTATRAADLIGESSGTCSFHLRQLAKYGLVEEAEGGTGREKPWRATTTSTAWDTPGDDTPEMAAAASLLSTVVAE